MIRYHGIPDASVASLLLFLCFTHSGLGENCVFTDSVSPTTGVESIIDGLKQQLLLDYPMSLPSNLRSDELCFSLWQLHFVFKELNRLLQVAGSELSKNITELRERMNLIDLFENCTLESDCVDFERANISVFLDSISSNFEAVKTKMELFTDFSSCTPIRCQPDSLSTPYPGYSAQQLENIQPSKSATLQRHHWLLIPIPLVICLLSVVKFSGRVPFQPLPPNLMHASAAANFKVQV